jgi:DNA-binding transcriptional LysR family regulator
MPRLLEQLSQQAPGMRIDIRHLSPSLPAEALDKGELDLVLGRFESIPARFARQHWMSETLQLALRREHPLATEAMDLPTFLQLRHLWVHGGQTRGMVDQWLGEQGLCREILYWPPYCRPSWRATLPACCRCSCLNCRSPSAPSIWRSSAWCSANATQRCIG